MNPALTPLSRIREMSNAELVAFAKEHSTLTILEREFLRRMEHMSKVLSSGKNLVESDEYRYFIRDKVGILNGALVRSK